MEPLAEVPSPAVSESELSSSTVSEVSWSAPHGSCIGHCWFPMCASNGGNLDNEVLSIVIGDVMDNQFLKLMPQKHTFMPAKGDRR